MNYRLIITILKVIRSPKQLDLVLRLNRPSICMMRINIFTGRNLQIFSRLEVHRLKQKLVKSVWLLLVVIIKFFYLLLEANEGYKVILIRSIYKLLEPKDVLSLLFLKA